MAAVGYAEERIRNQELNRILRNSLDSLETCDGCEVGSYVVVHYNSTTVVVHGTRKAKNGIQCNSPILVLSPPTHYASRDQGRAERGALGPWSVGRGSVWEQRPPGSQERWATR